MRAVEYVQQFIKLQSVITENYYKSYDDMRRRISSLDFTNYVYPKIIVVLWYTLVILQIISIILPAEPDMLRRLFSGNPSMKGLVANIFFSMIWMLILYMITFELPENIIKFLEQRFNDTSIKTVGNFLHLSVILPLSIILSRNILLYFISSDYQSFSIWSYIVVVIIIPLFSYAIGANAGIFFPMLPNIMLSLFSRLVGTKLSDFTISYDRIVHDTIQKSYDLIEEWPEEVVEQVRNISKHKSDNIAVQVQTISPIFSVISLFGLFALVFSQEQIYSYLDYLDSLFSNVTGLPVSGITVGFAITLFLLIVYAGCNYFIRVYQALSILKIIDMICDIRIAESKRDKDILAQKAVLQISDDQKTHYHGTYEIPSRNRTSIFLKMLLRLLGIR